MPLHCLRTIAALLFVVGVTPGHASDGVQNTYGWTITDLAGASQGSFVPGLLTLKLNYACNRNDGMSASEFTFVSKNPVNVLLAITAKNGFLNAGSGDLMLLAVGGCPDAQPLGEPVNAADILVLANAPGQYGLAPNPSNGSKVTVDCQANPAAWPIQWIGYSNDDTLPPQDKDWDKCAPLGVPVVKKSWGSIKAMYRTEGSPPSRERR